MCRQCRSIGPAIGPARPLAACQLVGNATQSRLRGTACRQCDPVPAAWRAAGSTRCQSERADACWCRGSGGLVAGAVEFSHLGFWGRPRIVLSLVRAHSPAFRLPRTTLRGVPRPRDDSLRGRRNAGEWFEHEHEFELPHAPPPWHGVLGGGYIDVGTCHRHAPRAIRIDTGRFEFCKAHLTTLAKGIMGDCDALYRAQFDYYGKLLCWLRP